jgi:hypothetical protein
MKAIWLHLSQKKTMWIQKLQAQVNQILFCIKDKIFSMVVNRFLQGRAMCQIFQMRFIQMTLSTIPV